MPIEVRRQVKDEITVFIDAASVKQALVDVAMARVKQRFGSIEGRLKLTIEQETEGSPSYSVDKWRATIRIVNTTEE